MRQLARDLNISRTTGERIQNVLCDATLAEVRPRSGVFVASPDDIAQRQHLLHVRAVYEFIKETVLRARELGLDSVQLARLIRAFDGDSATTARGSCFPIIATRDWFDCMLACFGPGSPARLVHLNPGARPVEFPSEARYLLSGYYMRGRAREIADAVRRPVIYVRYNAELLDRSMTLPPREFRYFVTRDVDNAESTRQFLASAYPEVPRNRYMVTTAAEFLKLVSGEREPRGMVWATITAAPLIRDRVPPERLQMLHPLLADDFIEEIHCLALFT